MASRPQSSSVGVGTTAVARCAASRGTRRMSQRAGTAQILDMRTPTQMTAERSLRWPPVFQSARRQRPAGVRVASPRGGAAGAVAVACAGDAAASAATRGRRCRRHVHRPLVVSHPDAARQSADRSGVSERASPLTFIGPRRVRAPGGAVRRPPADLGRAPEPQSLRPLRLAHAAGARTPFTSARGHAARQSTIVEVGRRRPGRRARLVAGRGATRRSPSR